MNDININVLYVCTLDYSIAQIRLIGEVLIIVYVVELMSNYQLAKYES